MKKQCRRKYTEIKTQEQFFETLQKLNEIILILSIKFITLKNVLDAGRKFNEINIHQYKQHHEKS
jgi:hypothetical protein